MTYSGEFLIDSFLNPVRLPSPVRDVPNGSVNCQENKTFLRKKIVYSRYFQIINAWFNLNWYKGLSMYSLLLLSENVFCSAFVLTFFLTYWLYILLMPPPSNSPTIFSWTASSSLFEASLHGYLPKVGYQVSKKVGASSHTEATQGCSAPTTYLIHRQNL